MAASMQNSIGHLAKMISPQLETMTSDWGKAFACYEEIQESLKIPIYFANPGSPYQPGRNGNANGLLREFFPKATDFSEVSEDECLAALLKINNRPRKCLGWKTPIYIFQHEVVHLI